MSGRRNAITVLAAALTAMGCGVESLPICNSVGTGGASGAAPSAAGRPAGPEPLAIAGLPATVHFAQSRPCNEPAAEALAVTVTDASFKELPATVGALVSNAFSHTASVTFVPPRPGSYHLIASFGVDVRNHQTNVVAGLDKSGASARSVALPDGVRCESLAVSATGVVVCDTGAQLWLLREGKEPENISARGGAWVGNSLWLMEGEKLSRFEDDGAHLIRKFGPVALDTESAPQRLYAQDEHLWVLDRLNFCHVEAGASGRGIRCAHQAGSPEGADSHGVWFSDHDDLHYATTFTLARLSEHAPPAVHTSTAVLPRAYPLLREPERTAALFNDSQYLLPTLAGDEVVMEVWPRSATLMEFTATAHHVFIRDETSPKQLQVYDR